jgi:DNA-binding transcriptional ArsR family regulator
MSSDQIAVLGDATRRQIVEILSRGPCSVADLAERMPVSRPAVSQHLKVLSDAGLVTHRAEGTRRLYQVDPEGLAALRTYLDSLWEQALSQFKQQAEKTRKPTSRKRNRK